jgi:hypothetical protein
VSVSDLDIYRSAKLLIDRHGDNAELEAARMFDEMTEKNDFEGRRLWRRIGEAIKDLDASRPNKQMM